MDAVQHLVRTDAHNGSHQPQAWTAASRSIGMRSEGLTVREISANDFNRPLIEQWEQLEEHALEPNAFLSPHFVLPALRHLTPRAAPIFLLVQTGNPPDSRLVGLGIFETSQGTLQLPLPHLKCYRSKHSYLDGLLVDAEDAPTIIAAIFDYVKRSKRWRGLSFVRRGTGSPLATPMQETANRFGLQWFPEYSITRPILRPAEVPPDYLERLISQHGKRELLRKRRKLQRNHKVEFRIQRCGPEYQFHSETLLKLESMGWKGAEQSALACRPNEVAFFQEMLAGFAKRNRVLFTELLADGIVIATTSNLLSGKAAFGFKMGWHQDFARVSPGKLNLLELTARAPFDLSDLDYFDSCTPSQSFVETIWPTRHTLASGLFTSSRAASRYASALAKVRPLLRSIKRRLGRRR